MLLEAYFMQLDSVFNRYTITHNLQIRCPVRLLTLSEYIDDTEDYINIVQDKHRNQLLQVRSPVQILVKFFLTVGVGARSRDVITHHHVCGIGHLWNEPQQQLLHG